MKLFCSKQQLDTALFALQLAQKEANYLAYTHNTLFTQAIDLKWVESLADFPEYAEKIDAFVSRFARLQDHLGNKLLPLFAQLYEAKPNSLIDTLTFAERMNWLESAEYFISLRHLRNQLVHEYLSEPDIFLDSLLSAQQGSLFLQAMVVKMEALAKTIQLN